MTTYEDKIIYLAHRNLWSRPMDCERKEIYENRYELMMDCDLWKEARINSLISCWAEGDDLERMDHPRYYRTTHRGYAITASTPKSSFTGVVPGFKIVAPIETLDSITVIGEFRDLQEVRAATREIKKLKKVRRSQKNKH